MKLTGINQITLRVNDLRIAENFIVIFLASKLTTGLEQIFPFFVSIRICWFL